MAPGKAPRVAVEWIYVRYNTLIVILVCLAVAAGVGIGWLWLQGSAERVSDAATRAIAAAAQAVTVARETAPDAPDLPAAEKGLAAAEASFAAADYASAVEEAEAAGALAREIVTAARGQGDVAVRIVRLTGDVRIKRAGQFLWEAASERSLLQPGDQIRTGSSGTAQLVYFDGAVMTISPGTLLEIQELYRDGARRQQRVSERLAWGRLQAQTQGNNGIETVHEVSTDTASVRARDRADFQVSHDRETRSSEVVAITGRVSLESEGREVELEESTRVALDRGRIVDSSTLLDPPRLLAPADQKTFVAPRESLVELAWSSIDEAAAYHVQLSDRPLFSHLIAELQRVVQTSVDLPPLPPGSYYWRIAAVDEHGHRGRWSDVRRFRVLGSEFRDPDDREPPPLDVAEILVVGTNAIISGRSEPGALVWIDGERVDVEDDGAFTWVIKLHQDGRNTISFLAQDAAGNETRRRGYAYVDAF
jgi:hypothetical protein